MPTADGRILGISLAGLKLPPDMEAKRKAEMSEWEEARAKAMLNALGQVEQDEPAREDE